MQPVSVFHKRQNCFLCVSPKISLAGTDVNEERLSLFLSDTEAESSPPPAHAPAPNLLLMESGGRTKMGIVLPSALGGGEGLTWHIPQKNKNKREASAPSLTPNWVSGNPVITAKHSGRLCGRWERTAIHRLPWPEGKLNRFILCRLKSSTHSALQLPLRRRGWRGGEWVAEGWARVIFFERLEGEESPTEPPMASWWCQSRFMFLPPQSSNYPIAACRRRTSFSSSSSSSFFFFFYFEFGTAKQNPVFAHFWFRFGRHANQSGNRKLWWRAIADRSCQSNSLSGIKWSDFYTLTLI